MLPSPSDACAPLPAGEDSPSRTNTLRPGGARRDPRCESVGGASVLAFSPQFASGDPPFFRSCSVARGRRLFILASSPRLAGGWREELTELLGTDSTES